jgi:nucleoid-associated protein YgaU
MRKDVKLGFAIGGVLLAVVVVYVLVVSGGDKKADQVSLITGDQNQTSEKTADQKSADDKSAVATNSDQAVDPFKSTSPTTVPSDSDKPKADDRWSAALSSGKLPVMMTETPSPKSTATALAVSAEANQPARASDSSSTPMVASNTPASVSPTTQPGSESRTHVVQSGETFVSIAQAIYGSSAYYPHLIRANPTIDPRRLKAGMTINVPPISDVKADVTQTSTDHPAVALDGKTEYRVASGDTLSKISLKLYGKRTEADKLYELNKTLIGPDPGKLKVGMLLKLPDVPTSH